MAKVRPYKGKHLLKMPRDFVIVDLETTGLTPETHEIIEIGAIKVVDMKVVGTFETLIKPTTQIPYFITNVTGITNKMVTNAPSVQEILPILDEFVGTSVVVGHNVNFDINFIYEAMMREYATPLTNDFVDTLKIARQQLKAVENHKLETLAKHFNVDTSNNHRALKDCEMTFAIYKELYKL